MFIYKSSIIIIIFICSLSIIEILSGCNSKRAQRSKRALIGFSEDILIDIKEACDPRKCSRFGFCKSYKRCNENGILEEYDCPRDKKKNPLWWNRDKSDLHASDGFCDLWDNLSEKLQDNYYDDNDCVPPCDFNPAGVCSPEYIFYDGAPEGTKFPLSCSTPLLWNPQLSTCDFCENVINNGKPCC